MLSLGPWWTGTECETISFHKHLTFIICTDAATISTDKDLADTDEDGISDYEEVRVHNTDPLDEDSDNDGLNDGAELNTHNTDPLNQDSDNDGLNDGEEVSTYQTDPLDEDTDVSHNHARSLIHYHHVDSHLFLC